MDLAKKLEKMAADKGVELVLATDVVVAEKFAADAENKIVDINNIPDSWMGLDVGPKTIETIRAALNDCKVMTHVTFRMFIQSAVDRDLEWTNGCF